MRFVIDICWTCAVLDNAFTLFWKSESPYLAVTYYYVSWLVTWPMECHGSNCAIGALYQ